MEFAEKAFNLEYEYKYKVHKLEKENTKLHKKLDTFSVQFIVFTLLKIEFLT